MPPEGGTVASWPSLSGSGSVSIHLAEEMCPEWESTVRSFHSEGGYGIFTSRFGADCPPPEDQPDLEPADLAFIPVLQAAFHGLNVEVQELQSLPRNVPPPAPDPDSKRFSRIRADWSIDSDADGSPDWAEFEMAGDPSHPFYLLADAFNGDVDNNQVLDGAQLDLDRDNTVDVIDSVPGNPQLSQPVTPIPRYAIFPVTPANPVPERKKALQINDRGTVLYVNGTWNGGQWQELAATNTGLRKCQASGINDEGEIVGAGEYEIPADPPIWRPVATHWASSTASPVVVRKDDIFAAPYFDFTEGNLTPGPVISNDGRVIAPSAEL